MKKITGIGMTMLLATTAWFAGCKGPRGDGVAAPDYPPLGSQHDNIMMMQETNAEASKYVVYAHEFELNDKPGRGWKLNSYGEDHLKQVAVNLKRGDEFPVVVERSETSVKANTEFEYPVHFNENLDARRREVVVAALQALGVADANQRVVVAPAFAEGYTAGEAARAYYRGLRGFGNGGGGFGGGGFGGGGFGGGGFGGGGF